MSEASAVIIFQSHLHHLHYIKCIASCFSNYNYNNDYYYGFCGSPWNICSWRFSDDPIFTLGLTCSCGSVKFVCDTQIQADQWWLQEASDDPESHPVLSSTLQNTAPWVLWLWYLSLLICMLHVSMITVLLNQLTFLLWWFSQDATRI